jgi:pimeloyl-ACP methyl ester carboxylesterase
MKWLRSSREQERGSSPHTLAGSALTRFVSDDVMRSGQQAARGCDIVQLADALGLERPILGGFDWGGNASCVAAALWPERIGGLVSYAGYDVTDVGRQRHPVTESHALRFRHRVFVKP